MCTLLAAKGWVISKSVLHSTTRLDRLLAANVRLLVNQYYIVLQD